MSDYRVKKKKNDDAFYSIADKWMAFESGGSRQTMETTTYYMIGAQT